MEFCKEVVKLEAIVETKNDTSNEKIWSLEETVFEKSEQTTDNKLKLEVH